MAKKSMLIAFANGGLLAAAAMGTKKDIQVPPLKPVEVPEAYGRHLVDDRFAYEVDEKAQKAKQDEEKRQAIAGAEAAVETAKVAVVAAGDDLAAKATAEAELAGAEKVLADLKA